MIELDIDSKIKIKDIEDIFNLPIMVLVNNFSEEATQSFREDFNDALATGQDVIPIIIDSSGGEVNSLLAMADIIRISPVPVATIVSGKAESCGAILLSCGTEHYRYVNKYARVLIHPVISGIIGNEDDINISASEIKRLSKVCFHMMAKNCGLPKKYFINKMKEKRNSNWYLSPKECLKINLAQHIGTPKFSVSISTNVDFCME